MILATQSNDLPPPRHAWKREVCSLMRGGSMKSVATIGKLGTGGVALRVAAATAAWYAASSTKTVKEPASRWGSVAVVLVGKRSEVGRQY